MDLPELGKNCTRCGGPTHIEEVDFWGLDERDPMRMAVKERIAIMLQRSFALYGDMWVIENIFEAFPSFIDEKAKIQRAIELLQMVNMTHRTTHMARDLSGGEKQRCVLARQLAREPILFLADEPTGTLDPQTAEIVHKALIEAVKCQGMTMVVTSHWPKAIARLSDKAIWLESGEMVKRGSPEEVVKEFEVGFEKTTEMLVPVGQPIIRCTDCQEVFLLHRSRRGKGGRRGLVRCQGEGDIRTGGPERRRKDHHVQHDLWSHSRHRRQGGGPDRR